MQVKQVAELLGIEAKTIIAEIESNRDDFQGKGYKIAKKLTAASALNDDLVRELMAELDLRRQKSVASEKEADRKRQAEEDERRRAADEMRRKQDEAERKARQEEAHKRAEAELQRKMAEKEAQENARRAAEEQERQASAARMAEEKRQQEADAARAAAEKQAAADAAKNAPPAPEVVSPAPQAAPAPPATAPVAQAPVPPPAQTPPPVSNQQTRRPAAPQAPLAPRHAPGAFMPAVPHRPNLDAPQPRRDRPQGGYQDRDRGPRPQGDRPPYQDRGPRPEGSGGERQSYGDRGPRPQGDRPYGDRPPRPAGDRPAYTDRGPRPQGDRPYGDRPPRPQGDRPAYGDRGPRPQGDRPQGDRPYGERPPRPQGDRPAYGDRGPRPQGDRPYGDRPPRPQGDRPYGDRGPRPGGDRSFGDRGPRPGGDRSFGDRGPRPGGPGARPASRTDIDNFISTGFSAPPTDDFKPRTKGVPRDTVKAKTKVNPKAGDEGANKPKKLKGADDGRRIRPSQLFNMDVFSGGDKGSRMKRKPQRGQAQPQEEAPKVFRLTGDFTVGEFAERTGLALNEVIKRLFLRGKMLTVNQLLDADLAEELAIEFEIEVVIDRESDENDIAEWMTVEDSDEDLVPRPPIVTIMGHVDHGKTSLLDKIRQADVASGEFGGITQHIGAYHVKTAKGDIVFLDTPGHEAFTEMRSRGANITDVVVLVVAANDGVMPQTVEAISHAKAAGVPIIVAINKIDVHGSNVDRVMQELMKHELVSEQYGGETIMLPVSAKTGQGLDVLLEYIALQTEIMELKANPNRDAQGTIIESHVDPLRGAVATVLVERGTLRIGDCFVCGTEYGRIRAMRDDRDHQVEEAGPAMPVEILGLRGSPIAGEKLVVVPSENEAREIAETRLARRRTRSAINKPHISLDNLADRLAEGEVLTLNLIVKGDVQGSVEAIRGSLLKIKSDKVALRILHAAVGAVSVSDVQLADASEAIVIGFNVGVDPAARSMAEETGVDVRSYQIIYALLEDMEKAMLGLLTPEFAEKEEGRALVKATFKASKVGTVAGCIVQEGAVNIEHKARLLRQGAVVWRGKLKSLRRVKDDVKNVLAGVECGIGLENFNDIKEGDIIETYSLVEKAVSLVNTP